MASTSYTSPDARISGAEATQRNMERKWRMTDVYGRRKGPSTIAAVFKFKITGRGAISTSTSSGSISYGIYQFLSKVENPAKFVACLAGVVAETSQRALASIGNGCIAFDVAIFGEPDMNELLGDYQGGTMLKSLKEKLFDLCTDDEEIEIDDIELEGYNVLDAGAKDVGAIIRESEEAIKNLHDFSSDKIELSKNPVLSRPIIETKMPKGQDPASLDISNVITEIKSATVEHARASDEEHSASATRLTNKKDKVPAKKSFVFSLEELVDFKASKISGGSPQHPATSERAKRLQEGKRLVTSYDPLFQASQELESFKVVDELTGFVASFTYASVRDVDDFAFNLVEAGKRSTATLFYQVAARFYKETSSGEEAAEGIEECCDGIYQAYKSLVKKNSDMDHVPFMMIKIMENLREMIPQLLVVDPARAAKNEAWCLLYIALTLQRLDDYHTAIATYERRVATFEDKLDSPNKYCLYGKLLIDHADALRRSSRFDEAVAGYRKAIEAYKQAEDLSSEKERRDWIEWAERRLKRAVEKKLDD